VKSVLVTGGNGFLGRSLCQVLSKNGFKIRATVRDEKSIGRLPAGVTACVTGPLEIFNDWAPFLEGIDAVIHLAAHVHQMEDTGAESETLYQRMNVGVSQALAEACCKTGVRRFIFASSVKVTGELTNSGEAWNELSPCFPEDAYGRSKFEAETILHEMGKKSGLEVVILRLPLVYGPGVKANFLRLFKAVDRGIPLPFANIYNRRSLVYIGNLIDAMIASISHPKAAGETFLVSDGEDISTPDLIRRIAISLERAARLFPVSPKLMRIVGRMIGKSDEIDRLLGSLRIDISKIREKLFWKPPYSMDYGLKQTAEWFLENQKVRILEND